MNVKGLKDKNTKTYILEQILALSKHICKAFCYQTDQFGRSNNPFDP